jgi:hypothetical protein
MRAQEAEAVEGKEGELGDDEEALVQAAFKQRTVKRLDDSDDEGSGSLLPTGRPHGPLTSRFSPLSFVPVGYHREAPFTAVV